MKHQIDLVAQRDEAPTPRVLAVAADIIRKADREHPADGLLRDSLKSRRDLLTEQRGATSRAVFSYYRWRGWLDERSALQQQIQQALALALKFIREPGSFADRELVERAFPSWLGSEMTVEPPFVRALQAEPRLWLRTPKGQARALAEALGDCRIFGDGPLENALEYLGRADLFRSTEFHEGRFEVQDISSQAVGLICAPSPGQTWWDACAGEGGKTLHLSDLMNNRGLIWASDRVPWRLQRLKRRAARARVFNYRAVPWEGGSRLPTKTKFDGVLVDAPCSGVGTWHRNPHARWTTTPGDVRELADLQLALLRHASLAVKPGGKFFYAVCTLTRSETIAIVAAFENSSPEFIPLPLRNPLHPLATPAERLFLQPEEFGGNGMFVAAWRRSGPGVKVSSPR